MMSSSRASRADPFRSPRQALATALLAAACLPAAAESPLPAVPRRAEALTTLSTQPLLPPQRVRIASARIVDPRSADQKAVRLLGASAPGALRGGRILAVDVTTPFEDPYRTASPVILIDGKPLDSAVDEEGRRTVVAIVPAQEGGDRTVTVQVGWLGDLERTISAPTRVRLGR